MKFSLFFEMQISEPSPEQEAKMFRDCVEQAVLADELGYHAVWAVEHHGLYEYSHSSAPEIFLAYVAAKTKRIRIGHGVTLLPFRYNHPIRIAERIATLDILSNGRVNWGTGKSASMVEQVAFENDISTLHDQWLEAVNVIPQMWSNEVFSYKGRFFDIAPTRIIPRPIQNPHPPMFGACTQPESAAFVGSQGLGALNFAIGNDVYLAKKVSDYRAAVEKSNPVGRTKNNHFACTCSALVLDSDSKACKYGYRGARFFADSLKFYYATKERPVDGVKVNREFFPDEVLSEIMASRNSPSSTANAIIGDPECARESIKRFAEIGMDEIILILQTGTVPHELVMESIKVFGEKVMPYFQ